jgi:SAM-dependent methyltransferase
MNEERHWNRIAHSYDNEIFDVFKSDKNKKLPEYFKKYQNSDHAAIDLGCGIGKAFPYLSPAFKKDLTDPELKLPSADFGFCCNVLLLPQQEKNFQIIRNAHRALRKKGSAVFVVPSLDSMMFYAWRLIDWNRKEGVEAADIPDSEFSYFSGSKRDLFQGLIRIDGVTTKHYSHPELEVIFRDAGFKVQTIDRIEYEWTTEFAEPPEWLKAPYPWDWLIEVSK